MYLTKRTTDKSIQNLINGLFNHDFNVNTNGLNVFKSIPPVNIADLENEFIIELAIPGVDKKSVIVDIDDHTLTISREKEETTTEGETEKTFTRKEFNFDTFKRSFSIPETVDIAGIEAKFKNGILAITLPKKEEAKAIKRTVKIS